MADEKFKPEFPHHATQEPVFVFPNPLHMLKNVRNNFAKTLKVAAKDAPKQDRQPLGHTDGEQQSDNE